VVQALYAEQMRRGGEAVYRDGAPNFRLLTGDWADREHWLAVDADSALARIARARR
jgi:hypothetical protein